MRRPAVILCMILIAVSYISTSGKNIVYDTAPDYITGIIKDKTEKDKYIEYLVDDIIVRCNSDINSFNTGDVVQVSGEYENMNDMVYDDFNYGRYLKSCGIDGYIKCSTIDKVGEDTFYVFIEKIRKTIREENRFLYKEKSDFLNSMLIGEKEFMNEEDERLFSRTGVSHIIAISGMHISILCVLIEFTGKILDRRYTLIISDIMIFIYFFVAGGTPSVGRAAAAAFLSHICFFYDVRRDGINTLGFIASIMIIMNEYVIYNTGFQLSFLAAFSIIYFYPIINGILKIPILSVTLSANIMTLPIIVYLFDGISVLSAIANILAVPFVASIVYMDIVSIIFSAISIIELGQIIAFINSSLIDFIYFLLDCVDKIWFSYIEFDKLGFSFIRIYYIIVCLGIKFYGFKVIGEQKNGLQGYCCKSKSE